MDRDSRPVVVAPLCLDEQGWCIKTATKRIGLKTTAADSIARLLNGASGHKTIAELANDVFSEQELIVFFRQLEALSACFEAHLVALYGHQVARYPDPLRIYPDNETVMHLIQLPADREGELIEVTHPVDEAAPLRKRQTCRLFSDAALSLDDLSKIAYAAYGLTGSSGGHFNRRAVPSAGAMYPLQIDYLVRRGIDINRGVYRWAKHQNGFIPYRSITEDDLQSIFLNEDWRSAAVIQVIGFDIARSAAKYASRAYRFALVEAGHAAQNSISQAVSLGIGAWEHGSYIDKRLMELVELNSVTSGVATVLFYGHPS